MQCALSTRAFKFAFVKKSYNFSCLQLSAEVSVNFGLELCCQIQIYNNFYSNLLGMTQFTFLRQKLKETKSSSLLSSLLTFNITNFLVGSKKFAKSLVFAIFTVIISVDYSSSFLWHWSFLDSARSDSYGRYDVKSIIMISLFCNDQNIK